MSDFNRFNKIIVSSVGIVSFILIATSFYLDKSSGGNMTRVGGYSDNDYGWNKPLETYAEPLFRLNSDSYQSYSDLLILGDSFSLGTPNMTWVNYFVEATGLTAQALHLDRTRIDQLLNSEGFIRHPPKYLIIESVEESLYRRFPDSQCVIPELNKAPRTSHSMLRNGKGYQVDLVQRETDKASLDLDHAGSFLAKAIPRGLGVNVTDTARLAINRNDLFSSQLKNHILIFASDLGKADWPSNSAEIIRCNLLNIQQQVEANGFTRLAIMVVPDKLSAYSEVLEDQSKADLSIIPALNPEGTLNLIRLDRVMRNKVSEGEVDLYLPNDTHWSSTGYRIAAEALVAFLNDLNNATNNAIN